jgi:hypothetical protein
LRNEGGEKVSKRESKRREGNQEDVLRRIAKKKKQRSFKCLS